MKIVSGSGGGGLYGSEGRSLRGGRRGECCAAFPVNKEQAEQHTQRAPRVQPDFPPSPIKKLMVLRRPRDFDISAVSLHRLPVMSDDAADIVIFPKVQEEQRWGRGGCKSPPANNQNISRAHRGKASFNFTLYSPSSPASLLCVSSSSSSPPLPPPFFFYSLPL